MKRASLLKRCVVSTAFVFDTAFADSRSVVRDAVFFSQTHFLNLDRTQIETTKYTRRFIDIPPWNISHDSTPHKYGQTLHAHFFGLTAGLVGVVCELLQRGVKLLLGKRTNDGKEGRKGGNPPKSTPTNNCFVVCRDNIESSHCIQYEGLSLDYT